VTGKNKNGEPVDHNYMKGATRVDNLAWISNLGGQLLIQRGLPIFEQDPRFLTSLESRKELVLAQTLCQAKHNNGGRKLGHKKGKGGGEARQRAQLI